MIRSFDTDLVYYLSGPMTGYENYNYDYFNGVERILTANGIKVESPHRNPRPENWETMDQHELWLYMMELCYKQMDYCQGIIMLKGWPQSTGARKELSIMLEKDAPVYYYHNYQLTSMNRAGPLRLDLDYVTGYSSVLPQEEKERVSR